MRLTGHVESLFASEELVDKVDGDKVVDAVDEMVNDLQSPHNPAVRPAICHLPYSRLWLHFRI